MEDAFGHNAVWLLCMAVVDHLVPALAAPISGLPRILGASRKVCVGCDIVPAQWPALLLIAWIVIEWWVIVTPEGDVYGERISLKSLKGPPAAAIPGAG